MPSSVSLPSLDDEPPAIHLGLTFSFPVEQTALDSGVLLTWTKGFAAKNAIGNDIVKLLQDAFDRKHMHVKCVALVNDVSARLILIYVLIFCNCGLLFIDGGRVALACIYGGRMYSWFGQSDFHLSLRRFL